MDAARDGRARRARARRVRASGRRRARRRGGYVRGCCLHYRARLRWRQLPPGGLGRSSIGKHRRRRPRREEENGERQQGPGPRRSARADREAVRQGRDHAHGRRVQRPGRGDLDRLARRSTWRWASAACRAGASSRSSARSRRARRRSATTSWPRPRSSAASCAFIDAEHALDPAYARRIGVDIDELLVSPARHRRAGARDRRAAGPLRRGRRRRASTRSRRSCRGPRSRARWATRFVGLQARLMSQALRKLAGTLNRTGTICIFINQLREKIGVMFGTPETTPGGRALKFYASVRLDIRRIETLKDGAEAYGNRVRVKVVKNKVAPPFRQAEFDIIYGDGISWEGTVLDVGVEKKVVRRAARSSRSARSGSARAARSAKAFLREHPDMTTAHPQPHPGRLGRASIIPGATVPPPERVEVAEPTSRRGRRERRGRRLGRGRLGAARPQRRMSDEDDARERALAGQGGRWPSARAPRPRSGSGWRASRPPAVCEAVIARPRAARLPRRRGARALARRAAPGGRLGRGAGRVGPRAPRHRGASRRSRPSRWRRRGRVRRRRGGSSSGAASRRSDAAPGRCWRAAASPRTRSSSATSACARAA